MNERMNDRLNGQHRWMFTGGTSSAKTLTWDSDFRRSKPAKPVFSLDVPSTAAEKDRRRL